MKTWIVIDTEKVWADMWLDENWFMVGALTGAIVMLLLYYSVFASIRSSRSDAPGAAVSRGGIGTLYTAARQKRSTSFLFYLSANEAAPLAVSALGLLFSPSGLLQILEPVLLAALIGFGMAVMLDFSRPDAHLNEAEDASVNDGSGTR